ncbi:MAG: Tfp pilus assembly protein FimT/FimU [Candidatus Methylomirabilales bacterium]
MKAGRKGLTAMEVVIAVALVAILAGVAMPVFLTVIQNYRFKGAVRSVASDIRYAQSLAVTNGGIYGFHWGGDPNEVSPPGPNFYRIEKNTGTVCNWPLVGDTVGSNANVITNWFDLSAEFQGITIDSITDSTPVAIGGVAFNSRGASDNPCTGVTYPITITVSNASGTTKTIEVRSAGSVRIQ